jgi:hypothetical protein
MSTDRPPARWSAVRERGLARIALAAAMLGTAALVVHLTRGLTFYYDEWSFVADRQGLSADTLLRPHNDHIVLLPLLVYKVFFDLFGLDAYWPFLGSMIVLHLLCVGLLYEYARRRIGDLAALLPALLLLTFGAAWEVILWPFEITFLMPLAGGLAALLALDRGDRRGDLAAGGLFLLSFASGSLAIPLACGAAVRILFEPDRLRRLLIVVVAPALPYLAWVATYSREDDVGTELLEQTGYISRPLDSLPHAPEFIADAAGANLAALLSLGGSWGWVLALALTLAVAYSVLRRRDDAGGVVAALAIALSYFLFMAMFRAWAIPLPSRYLYPGGLFLLLIAIEVWRRVAIPRGVLLATGALTLVVAASNVGGLSSGADRLRTFSDWVGPSLGALEIAGQSGRVDAGFEPLPLLAPYIRAEEYFSAVRGYGSQGTTAAVIRSRAEPIRRASDAVLGSALRPRLREVRDAVTASEPPQVARVAGGTTRREGGCIDFAPSGRRGSLELEAPELALTFRVGRGADGRVRLRRFADGYGPDYSLPGQAVFEQFPELRGLRFFGTTMPAAPVLRLTPGREETLSVPADQTPLPWYVRLTTERRARVCSQAP